MTILKIRQDYSQKRRDIYLTKNGTVHFSKPFICRAIIELMKAELRRPFVPTRSKTKDLSLKDNSYFIPNDFYKKLCEVFIAYYNKKPDRNVFYICIRRLEKDKKIEKIKIKRQVYYKLL